MPPEEVLASLVDLAKRTGIRVRFDEITTDRKAKGGLCVVRGEPLVVLDVKASPLAQAEILAGALARYGVFSIYGPRLRIRLA
jgi:glycine cleavage system pyridoxal-binding protein P